MAATNQLNQYVRREKDSERESIIVEAGAFQGWVPRAIYSSAFHEVHLPFLKLYSFPCGGTPMGCLHQNLTIFKAIGNYLSQLPLTFANCHCLKHVDLSYNQFHTIPESLYKFTQLEEINLEHNYLLYVDRQIRNLKNLKVLNLGGNLLNNIPSDLGECKAIKDLNLSGKFYAKDESYLEDFPVCVCNLPNLVRLDLSWQRIKVIPASIKRLKKLEQLNLKWNHLIEVSLNLKKCSKLNCVNISGALRLKSEIPEALLSLEDIEVLNFSDNFFTEIPSTVCRLVEIKSLNIQRSCLLFLSEEIYKLRFLEVLELNQNYLRSLPEGLKLLKRLTYLGLDNNELESLPDEIGCLEQLKRLSVSKNQLTELPDTIVHLKNLDVLNLEDNLLTKLPLLMDRMHNLAQNDSLYVRNNNFSDAYNDIIEQGTAVLFHYLKGIRAKEATHRWKMILIGAAHAGKTSLCRALMSGKSQLTQKEERTWVMERHLWEPESRLRIQVLDFGGHHIYQAAHHMFLSSEAFHVLVFDLSQYTRDKYDELIGHWLDAIMDKASGASIIIAGTHCDMCSKEDIDESTEDILHRMRRNEERRLSLLRSEITKLTDQQNESEGNDSYFSQTAWRKQKIKTIQKMLNVRSKVPDQIHVLSCAGELIGLSDFHTSLIKRLKSSQSSEMPITWFRFLERLQQLPEENVVAYSDALQVFTEVMQNQDSRSTYGVAGSTEKSLEAVLRYLHKTGEIAWYHENDQLKTRIFHRTEKLINMLRAVFRHDFDIVLHYEPDFADITSLQKQQFDSMKKNFLNKGFMTEEFMKYVLVCLRLSTDGSNSFVKLCLSIMKEFELCFEVTNEHTKALLGSEFVVQFPWFFPVEQPENLVSRWPQELPEKMFELTIEIVFHRKMPPNFFEKLSVKLHDFVSAGSRDNWKDGVLAQRNSASLLVQKETRDQDTVIVVSARGTEDLTELWSLIKNVRHSTLLLIPQWPMLKCEFYLVCMHCLMRKLEEPHRYPGCVLEKPADRTIYHQKCCEKMPNDRIPTCFVFPLEKSEYPEDQDSYKRHMQEVKAFLDGPEVVEADEVDSSGRIANDWNQVAHYLVENLGEDWEMFVLTLGLKMAVIDDAKNDIPHSVRTRIFRLLTQWNDSQGVMSLDDKVITVCKALNVVSRLDLAEELKEKMQLEDPIQDD